MIENREILKFFPQPVFRYRIENHKEINHELLKYIYKLKEMNEEGLERSKFGKLKSFAHCIYFEECKPEDKTK